LIEKRVLLQQKIILYSTKITSAFHFEISTTMYIIYDDNNYKSKVFVTYILIAINVIVYLGFQIDSSNLMGVLENNFFKGYCMLPAEILSGKDVVIPGYFEASPHPVYLTIITSMFMHGGVWHLLGNMFFLFVFGDNLESALGPVKFLFFYLLCGVLASLLDITFIVLLDLNTYTRNIGASGAISGIIGAYMMLFPRNKIHLIFNIFIGFWDTPAFLWGIIWMTIQIIGLISIIYDQSGGVAYAAHIGGSLAGFFMVKLFLLRKKKNEIVTEAEKI
jgi:membrane associated rhomboid family serine protease